MTSENRRRLVIIGVILVAGLGYFVGRRWRSSRFGMEQPKQETASAQATDFELPDVAGKKVRLSDFRGKVVILDFWATWCEPCLEEIEGLIELHKKYRDKNFTLLGVALDDAGGEVVAPFIKASGIPYPVLLSPGGAPEAYHVFGLPTKFLIDGNGRIVKKYLGPQSPETLAADALALLGEK